MKFRLFAAGLALSFGVLSVAPLAIAQTRDENGRPLATEGTTRAGQSRQSRQRRQQRQTAPSPEQIMAAAQEQATLAQTGCQVTEAKLLGTTTEQTSVYEIACAAGPGYMIESKTPPEAVDCVVLASSAEKIRARDPQAEVGSQCSLPANTDTQKFLREYAQQAGVPCTVDQASVLGTASDGAITYEIGCADMAGYWIRKSGDSWTKTDCLQVVAESGTCAFTTPTENAALLKSWLAGSEAANCDVTEARLMGRNDNGMFYEAKCAGADGVIARLNAEHAVQQIYACATAQRIGGGCTLTPAPAAPAATEQ